MEMHDIQPSVIILDVYRPSSCCVTFELAEAMRRRAECRSQTWCLAP